MSQTKKFELLLNQLQESTKTGGSLSGGMKPKAKPKPKAKRGAKIGSGSSSHLGLGYSSTGGARKKSKESKKCMCGGGFLGTQSDKIASNWGDVGFSSGTKGNGDDWYGNKSKTIRNTKGAGTKKGQSRKTARKAYVDPQHDFTDYVGAGTKKGQSRKTARKAYVDPQHDFTDYIGGSKAKISAGMGASSCQNSVHGRPPANKTGGKAEPKKKSAWLVHVAKVRKMHSGRGLTQPQIVKLASASYKKK